MRLKKFRVTNYKSIEDSGDVAVSDITCLVGKNESGKTALLEALGRINAAGALSQTFELDHYPRHGLLEYKRVHKEEPASAIEVALELTDAEISKLNNLFGKGTIKDPIVEVEKRYDNIRYFSIQHDEVRYVSHLLSAAQLPNAAMEHLRTAQTFKDLLNRLRNYDTSDKAVQDFHYDMENLHDRPLIKRVIHELSLPEFFYFDEYALMPGTISMTQVKRMMEGDKSHGPGLQTAKMLLDRIGADVDDFLRLERYEELKSELEVASNMISDQIFDFWSQSKDLEIEISLQPKLSKARTVEDTVLALRIKDVRQRVSIPFEQRSRGFVWFFSFLVRFGEYERQKKDVILLLDEPGYHLHARAQGDLLKFFEKQLAPRHQVIYTTHSPFMVDPKRTDRVRVVLDSDEGTRVANKLSDADAEALRPVRAALGFELVDDLFNKSKSVLVRSPADVMLLSIASQELQRKSRTGLNPGIELVPTGGLARVATFFAMVGERSAQVAILVDGDSADLERLQPLLEDKRLAHQHLVPVSEHCSRDSATLEDLFDAEAYLKAVEASLKGEKSDKDTPLDREALTSGKRGIANMLTQQVSGYDRLRTACELARDNKLIKALFTADTLDRFEKVIQSLNGAFE